MSKFFDDIKGGLNEALEYEKGSIKKARRRIVNILPVPKYKSNDIKEIRNKINLSQVAFANLLGVSVKSVESWESGKAIPQGSTQRLLDLIKKDYKIVEKIMI